MTEHKKARRTWFVTLTFNQAARARVFWLARQDAGDEWFELSQEQRSIHLARAAQEQVTLWIKRVREQSGAGLRYMLVTELHKDGFPHIHALVHEDFGEKRVLHRHLSGAWASVGFSNAKLCDPDDPTMPAYVCKYLQKDPVTRVRASVGYGHDGANTG